MPLTTLVHYLAWLNHVEAAEWSIEPMNKKLSFEYPRITFRISRVECKQRIELEWVEWCVIQKPTLDCCLLILEQTLRIPMDQIRIHDESSSTRIRYLP